MYKYVKKKFAFENWFFISPLLKYAYLDISFTTLPACIGMEQATSHINTDHRFY